MQETPQQRARRAAGEAAAALVESGMVVGLGTGDSASYAIRALHARVQAGLSGLHCVPTSRRTADLARNLGLPLLELDDLAVGQHERLIDVTIDGADEIDPQLRLVKGAGGALLLEKLVAHSSRKLVIVADTAKRVSRLGEKRLLPVEVVSFGVPQTLQRMQIRFPAAVVRQHNGLPQVTDGGNRLIDVPVSAQDAADPEALHRTLKQMLGVIETGLFLHEAQVALLGNEEGSVTRLDRPAG